MIEPITLARPYAKAAFEHARGAGELARWQDALEQLAAVTRDHKVSVMLKSPSQTAQQRAENSQH
jgi:F-type H+-transporting ATPase subunit delta